MWAPRIAVCAHYFGAGKNDVGPDYIGFDLQKRFANCVFLCWPIRVSPAVTKI